MSLRYELTVHRFEGELYPVVSNNYRVGGWLLGEILVQNLRVRDVQTQSDSVSTSDFIMGVGGVAEISPGTNMFARLKGAYTFLQNQTGVYLEGEGKFFPQFDGGFRPYLGAGYRYRFMQWTLAEGNMKWNVYAHGPFAEFGIIF
ncbi:MAG: hypothetical protein FJY85_11425 [Deltaproteobacteria bacterium]|nr:hypothetical protein [Deltaproteobacteria bacterium]